MTKLVLIDSHAILHRAYHALPPLTSPDGTVINAIYGFTTMFLTLLETLKPTHIVAAFDLPTPTFRSQLYTHYQGKRPDMEGNLVGQIPLVKEMLDALGVQRFEVAGFEADDVIGTLARQASGMLTKDNGLQPKRPTVDNSQSTVDDVIIVTGDRDMLQLVNDSVSVLVPIKGLKETKLYNREAVETEFGVKPEQWIDVKALKGDASDNYPGVSGIGPKTALDLIKTYGNLEEVYRNLGKINPKVATRLAEGSESAGLGKKLATIVTDVPLVHLDLEVSEIAKIDWEKGASYMKENLGFKTIVGRIEKEFLTNKVNEMNKINKDIKISKTNHEMKKPGEQMELI